MRNVSLRDLMLADSLSHIKSEVALIHPNNDKEVNKVLAAIGFDVRQPVEYIPSFHRDMQGNAAVGFQAVGEYMVDPKYNKFIDTMDRVIVAGLTDISLAREMSELLGKRQSYHNADESDLVNKSSNHTYYTDEERIAMGYTGDESEEDDNTPIENSETITSQIEALLSARVAMRGK